MLTAIAVTLVVFQFTFRAGEAGLAAMFFRFFTPVLAASRAPNIWFGLGTAHAFGLVITPDCTSSLLLVPLCGLGALLGHLVLGSLVSIVGIGLSLVPRTAIVASRRGLEFSAALLPRHRRRRS